MSQITVGYTDKVRRQQPRGPAGGISDIFGFSEEETNRKRLNDEQQQKTDSTNIKNDDSESNICVRTESLTIEKNCNENTKTVVTSTQVEEITSEVINNGGLNGNAKENGNSKENGNVEATPKKAVNNIIHADERDSATPQRRNRVPPGGYSSGLW